MCILLMTAVNIAERQLHLAVSCGVLESLAVLDTRKAWLQGDNYVLSDLGCTCSTAYRYLLCSAMNFQR